MHWMYVCINRFVAFLHWIDISRHTITKANASPDGLKKKVNTNPLGFPPFPIIVIKRQSKGLDSGREGETALQRTAQTPA